MSEQLISMMQLSEEQQNALRFIYDFIDYSGDHVAVIKGKAGTGKTTIVKFIVSWLDFNEFQYTLLAPTNKAANVLSRKTNKEVSTIHSFLRMSPKIDILDLDMKDLQFQSKFNEALEPKHVIICDEGSMVNDDLYDFLKEICVNFDCKIIYVLDEAQLAPVKNEHKSKTTLCENSFSLSHIFRQPDESSLTDILLTLRKKDVFSFAESKNLKVVKSRKELANTYLKSIYNDVINLKVSSNKLLCYTNKQVAEYNLYCHYAFFKNKDKFNIGDQIVFKENNSGSCIVNGENGVIVDVKEADIEIPMVGVFSGYDLTIVKDTDETVDVKVLSNSLQQEELDRIAYILENIRQKAIHTKIKKDWAKYYDAYNSFFIRTNLVCDGRIIKTPGIDYGYAVTTHYSQGSTYNDVFIDIKDMNICRNIEDRRQLKYVAMSRPRNNVYIYNG